MWRGLKFSIHEKLEKINYIKKFDFIKKIWYNLFTNEKSL